MITLILVHGALLTSSIWMPVQSYLQNKGYNVVTIDVPGRVGDGIAAKNVSLAMAAEKICKVASLQSSPVVLVGHSQGGAVITEAINLCATSIKGLVYIAAVVPHAGEKAFDLLDRKDGNNFDKVTTLDVTNGVYQINYDGPLQELFMADADASQAAKAIQNMVPEPISIGDTVLQYDQTVFNSIPKFYIKTEMDKIISPHTQDNFINRDNFKHIYTLNTSHSPFISQPTQLANDLIEVVDLLNAARK